MEHVANQLYIYLAILCNNLEVFYIIGD